MLRQDPASQSRTDRYIHGRTYVRKVWSMQVLANLEVNLLLYMSDDCRNSFIDSLLNG